MISTQDSTRLEAMFIKAAETVWAKKAITVVIPTYNRPDILMNTVHLIRENLVYDGPVNILVGDDSEEETPYVDASVLTKIVRGPQRGLGANLNNMLQNHVETDIVLQMDDDHWLKRPLDINQYVDDLRSGDGNIGWIRLFLGEHDDMYNLKGYYKFKAANYGPYWYIDVESPELYIASNRPHIKLTSFHRVDYGWYHEDKPLGKTEESFCHQYKDLRRRSAWADRPWVVVPMLGLSFNQWSHVGDSWQKQGL